MHIGPVSTCHEEQATDCRKLQLPAAQFAFTLQRLDGYLEKLCQMQVDVGIGGHCGVLTKEGHYSFLMTVIPQPSLPSQLLQQRSIWKHMLACKSVEISQKKQSDWPGTSTLQSQVVLNVASVSIPGRYDTSANTGSAHIVPL